MRKINPLVPINVWFRRTSVCAGPSKHTRQPCLGYPVIDQSPSQHQCQLYYFPPKWPAGEKRRRGKRGERKNAENSNANILLCGVNWGPSKKQKTSTGSKSQSCRYPAVNKKINPRCLLVCRLNAPIRATHPLRGGGAWHG